MTLTLSRKEIQSEPQSERFLPYISGLRLAVGGGGGEFNAFHVFQKGETSLRRW